MTNDSFSSTFLRISLIQLPVFVLTVIIYGLSVSLLNNSVTSASIALSQFAGDGVSLTGIFIGVILMGAFNLTILIGLFIFGSIIKSWSWYILTLGLINLVFNLISEALFFKFASCFNFPSNTMVVSRSGLVIILMIIKICVAIFAIIHYLERGDSGKEKFGTLLALVIILPSLIVLLLNAILIVRLKPQLNYYIEPSSLKMGFFNPLEMSQIENGKYAKTSTFEQQVIGNLGDIVFSPNNVLSHKVCSKYGCKNFYSRKYLYQIKCTKQSVLFYKDCATNTTGLTIYITYLDSGPYPSYNCLVNQEKKNALLCALNFCQRIS